ncbi:MAG: hypothetical protein J5790_10850 [Bacteroidaceae bacterium]|nr:hypothetical protein [Bacteroidaceae bacterium]
MNRVLLIALLLVCVTSQTQAQFTLTTKKVDIEAQSFIHPWSTLSFDKATKYHGDYYCHFTEHISDPNLMIGCDHIFCVAPDGKKMQRVSKSETTRLGRYDEMVVRHDSLLMISSQSYDTPRYIENGVLRDLKRPSDGTVYEDDDFIVKYTDEGEWGDYLSFIERKNGKEHLYRTMRASTRILKRPDGYYLLSPYQVLRIVDPRQGKEQKIIDCRDLPSSQPEVLHDITNGRYTSTHLLPGERIDTTYQAMFIHKGQIHLLVSTPEDTYIGLFTGTGVVPQYKFGKPLGKMRHVARGQNQSDDAALCVGFDRPVIVDIHGDSIDMLEFDLHLPEPKYVGDTGFAKTIRFLTEHFDNLRMPNVQVLERDKGGISTNITNINAWLNESVISAKDRMVFYTLADSLVTLETIYHYNRASLYVDQVDIHFIPTQHLLQRNLHNHSSDPLNKEEVRKEIFETISKALDSKPLGSTWTTSNMTISYYDPLYVSIKKKK